jgi:cardiolipin synthase
LAAGRIGRRAVIAGATSQPTGPSLSCIPGAAARVPCRRRPIFPWLLLAAISLCHGCRTVPVISETTVEHAPSEFQLEVRGTRGPLSSREARAVLNKLKNEARDGDALARHLAIEQAVADSPLYTSNRVRILRDGEQTFPAMFAALHSAQRTIQLEYYIFEDTECAGEHLSDLLIAKQQQGVSVSVIYDAIGSLDTPRAFFIALKNAGVQLLEFHPINPLQAPSRFSLNARDHRKMLIVDGELGIVGGINMSHTYQTSGPTDHGGSSGSSGSKPKPEGAAPEYWRDTDLEIHGPAIAQLEELFLDHWRSQLDSTAGVGMYFPHVAPAGSEIVRIIGSVPSRAAARYYVTLLAALGSASASIRLTTGYFVPTRQERKALQAAARRGVDVQLMLPSQSDSKSALAVQHSTYGELLKAGVVIYEEDGAILHSKSLLVDDVWAALGSSNFDHRSVLFNDEVDAIVLGKDTGTALEQLFQDDMSHAHRVDARTWRHRSLVARATEIWWRLWQRLL